MLLKEPRTCRKVSSSIQYMLHMDDYLYNCVHVVGVDLIGTMCIFVIIEANGRVCI